MASTFNCLRAALHDLLQVVTSSQQRSHFLRHVKGRLHTVQIFEGRFSFFTPRGILLFRILFMLRALRKNKLMSPRGRAPRSSSSPPHTMHQQRERIY
jgi:hypothetical protein